MEQCLILHSCAKIHSTLLFKQVNPPAGKPQEAYRPWHNQSPGRGYSSPVLAGGYPSPVLARGGSPVLSWPGGYPSTVLAGDTPVLGTLSQDWGTPNPRKDIGPEAGVPLERTWDQRLWYPPPPKERTLTRDLRKNLGLGYPGCKLTNKLKILPAPILRMRAVKIQCNSVVKDT